LKSSSYNIILLKIIIIHYIKPSIIAYSTIYYYIEINSYKTNHNFNDSFYIYIKHERFSSWLFNRKQNELTSNNRQGTDKYFTPHKLYKMCIYVQQGRQIWSYKTCPTVWYALSTFNRSHGIILCFGFITSYDLYQKRIIGSMISEKRISYYSTAVNLWETYECLSMTWTSRNDSRNDFRWPWLNFESPSTNSVWLLWFFVVQNNIIISL